MATTITEILGEQLIQHNDSNTEPIQISTNELNGKTIALYFSLVFSINVHLDEL